MLPGSVVEEFFRSSLVEVMKEKMSRLTLGVGRGKLANALARLYRDVRGPGVSFNQLSETTGAVNEAEHSDFS